MVKAKELCPQVEPVEPPSVHRDMFRELEGMFWTEEFRLHAYESLGGAVRVPTETQDEEKPPNKDPEHWKPFEELHAYLERRFPLMHSNLSVTKVNSFALIFHWQGSDKSLKPILLTSHQDVVPVDPETASQWVHPPFSGHFDGEWIWGRGSCDDKSGLIASMTAVETLLSIDFQPERSIVLAMGIDEERGGVYGATAIRDHLLSTYGKNAFSILIDEGGGYSEKFGATIATPAVAEKGKLDVRVQISTPGGHSSVPPPHTSIGILSRLITELEDNPHPTQLRREGTYYQQLQCLGEHAPSLPATLKKLIKASLHDNTALKQLQNELEKNFREARPSTGTTQAVDIIHGGVKSNALPEQAYAIVNHRIADYSSVAELEARFTSIVAPLAKQFNLSLDAFGDDSLSLDFKDANGHVALSDAYGSALNPAPVSPTFGNGPWDLLSGSILYTFMTNQRSSDLSESEKFAVAPGLSLDTRYYWDLTKHIFRYGHLGASDRYNGAHTVNEGEP
ncbi:Zn-dependent exopeptidase [Fomitiporia mediterranea MF3/22]|uniref:Zn-dependent exopeptidase n=1 Tax=Fomitiporia mediterranea (strain MF3/22) TaxID=694068 RepID=UPI0004409963|nr:Zn-dependent exopeptidase [Fomitiporia mediterranea MF3/22]EJD07384.1 Zn-dependent exopeptidase [Fomitiporia mediterranea MF3/22]